jgi:hypothetical protein
MRPVNGMTPAQKRSLAALRCVLVLVDAAEFIEDQFDALNDTEMPVRAMIKLAEMVRVFANADIQELEAVQA